MKKAAMILAILMLVFIGSAVFAEEGYEKDMTSFLDVTLVRPVSLASIVVGTAVFFVALPFSLPSGSVGKTAKMMIVDPIEFTFCRPIGEFESQNRADDAQKKNP